MPNRSGPPTAPRAPSDVLRSFSSSKPRPGQDGVGDVRKGGAVLRRRPAGEGLRPGERIVRDLAKCISRVQRSQMRSVGPDHIEADCQRECRQRTPPRNRGGTAKRSLSDEVGARRRALVTSCTGTDLVSPARRASRELAQRKPRSVSASEGSSSSRLPARTSLPESSKLPPRLTRSEPLRLAAHWDVG